MESIRNLSSSIQEAFSSIRENKSRSILSGFGVAWGIFILILLLATGNGFQDGILQLFNVFAKNSIWVYGGQASEINLNNPSNHKPILFNTIDLEIIKDRFSSIESISPELNYISPLLIVNQNNTTYAQIRGVTSDYFRVKIIRAEDGRLLNVLDDKERKRVALIGKQIADALFPQESAVGKSINLAGVFYKVIGVIENGSLFTQNEQNFIYLPLNTFVSNFNSGREFNTFILTLSQKADVSDFENDLKALLSREKGFSSNDKGAIFIVNFENQVKAFNKLFKSVNSFLWFIGLSLLLSGIVGIGNIMFVIVKERAFEIGVRKAVGAKARSIIQMIIVEAIVITTLAGVVGMMLGIFFIGIINWALTTFADKQSLFAKANVDFYVILFALIILIASGVLAGFLPAKKASQITPIEALRAHSK